MPVHKNNMSLLSIAKEIVAWPMEIFAYSQMTPINYKILAGAVAGALIPGYYGYAGLTDFSDIQRFAMAYGAAGVGSYVGAMVGKKL